MAGRIRSIKPEILEDEPAAALSDAAWRLWVSSWLLADDHGRFRAGVKYLASNVWQDSTRTADAEAALEELVRKRFLRLYEVDGQRYGEIKPDGWKRHQRVDHPGKPRVPVPNDSDYLPRVSRSVSADSATVSCETPSLSVAIGPHTRAQDPVVVGGSGQGPEGERGGAPESSEALPAGPETQGCPPADGDPSAEQEFASRAKPRGQVPGELIDLARVLAADGNSFGRNVCERLDAAKMPTPPQMARLRVIWDERMQAAAPASESTTAGDYGLLAPTPPHRPKHAQTPPPLMAHNAAGEFVMWEELTPAEQIAEKGRRDQPVQGQPHA